MNQAKKAPEFIHAYWMTKAYIRQYDQGLRSTAAAYGLSALETELVLALSHRPASDSLTKLCAEIHKTKGVVSEACDHLQKIGYITATADAKDRRVIHYHLTAAARPFLSAAVRHIEGMEADFPVLNEIISAYTLNQLNLHLGGAYLTILRVQRKNGGVQVIKHDDTPGKVILPAGEFDFFRLLAHWEQLAHDDDKGGFQTTLESMDTGSENIARLPIDGAYRWFCFRADPLGDDSAVVTVRDIDAQIASFLTKTTAAAIAED